jgi:hypothetical protein
VDLSPSASIALDPRVLWMPTESEIDMVEAQKNNPVFHLPTSLGQALPLESGYLGQDGPSQTTGEDIAEEKILSSVPNDGFRSKSSVNPYSKSTAKNPLDDSPASTSGISSEPSAEPSQSDNSQSPPDLARPQPATLRTESNSNISLTEEIIKQKIIHCPAPHCTRTFTKQYKLK